MRDARVKGRRSTRRGAQAWSPLLAAPAALGLVAGCEPPPAPGDTGGKTEARSEPLTSATDRVIPLDAVYLRGAGEGAPAPGVRLSVEQAVAMANIPFQRAGIQFYLRSFRHVSAPILATYDPNNQVFTKWAPTTGYKIRDEITEIFGANPWPTRPGSDEKIPEHWMGLAVSERGVPDGQYVFVGSQGNGSQGPNTHRFVYMNVGDLTVGNGLFAHELGHSFGLNHTWQAFLRDAMMGAYTTPASYWDISYCPGSSVADPHTFPTNPSSANCPNGPLTLVHGITPGIHDCTLSGSAVSCILPGRPGTGYSETQAHDSTALRRGMTYRDPDGVAGVNQMTYIGLSGANGFSPSQTELMRKTLRFDRRENLGDVVGGLSNNPLRGKPRLGTAQSVHAPTYMIDVNLDGARDLVTWTVDPWGPRNTNNGVFEVAFAPTFSGRQSRNFGRAGDIPIMMDFNGDGRTDHGVFRPDEAESGLPSSGATWYWCASTSTGLGNCEFGGYNTIHFGEARDVPLLGLSMGGAPNIGVYRAENTTAFWGPASNPFPFGSIALDPADATRAHTLVLDDWDGDGKTDIGAMHNNTASMYLALSTDAWASIRAYHFPSPWGYNVPNPDPNTYLGDGGSGAIPFLGLRRATAAPPSTATASAIGIWSAGTSTACVRTTIATGGTACDYQPPVGDPTAVLVGGLRHPTAGSGVAVPAWISQPAGGTVPSLNRLQLNTGSQSFATPRPLTGARTRGAAVFVADMGLGATKDGAPELLVEAPDPGRWLVFWSHTDYTTSTAVAFDSHAGRMLL